MEKRHFLKVSQLLLSPIVWRRSMQIMAISILYPCSSKFIFTKATNCVVQRDSWPKKSDKWFFLTENRIQRRNLVYLVNKWIHVWSSGGCLSRLFHFKAFKECLPQLHSTQFSLLHYSCKCFSFQKYYNGYTFENVCWLAYETSRS